MSDFIKLVEFHKGEFLNISLYICLSYIHMKYSMIVFCEHTDTALTLSSSYTYEVLSYSLMWKYRYCISFFNLVVINSFEFILIRR